MLRAASRIALHSQAILQDAEPPWWLWTARRHQGAKHRGVSRDLQGGRRVHGLDAAQGRKVQRPKVGRSDQTPDVQIGGRSQRPSRGRSVQTHRRATTLRTSDHIWIYKEADFPPDLALRSQQSVYSELLQLRNPRLCTHHSDPIPSLRSSPSGTDTLPSVVGEHGDLWSRDDRHQRLPLNKGTSRSKGNRLATTQSRIDLL